MSTLGKICKAYMLQQFRQFPGWKEASQNARKIWKEIDGESQEITRSLQPTDYLYLQEDFTVTDGIFIGENVIFDDVTPEWIQFCQTTLAFPVIPARQPNGTNSPSPSQNS